MTAEEHLMLSNAIRQNVESIRTLIQLRLAADLPETLSNTMDNLIGTVSTRVILELSPPHSAATHEGSNARN